MLRKRDAVRFVKRCMLRFSRRVIGSVPGVLPGVELIVRRILPRVKVIVPCV